MLTEREIFVKVRDHLLAQNVRAVKYCSRQTIICAYRGRDGASCAAGCLINDDQYSSDLEGNPCTYPTVESALIASGVDMNDARINNLVADLQSCHDNILPHNWKIRLDEIEREFNLIPPEET